MTNEDRIAAWRRRYTAVMGAPNTLAHEQQKAAGIDWRRRCAPGQRFIAKPIIGDRCGVLMERGALCLDHRGYPPLEPVPRIGRLMRLVTWGG